MIIGKKRLFKEFSSWRIRRRRRRRKSIVIPFIILQAKQSLNDDASEGVVVAVAEDETGEVMAHQIWLVE